MISRIKARFSKERVVLTVQTLKYRFRQFTEARTQANIIRSFDRLIKCAPSTAEGSDKRPFERLAESQSLPWKAKDIWKNFTAQLQEPVLKNKKIAIVGAGPVGLRAAIAFSARGADVVVVEKREGFVRVNRLHLWKTCFDVLILGVLIYFNLIHLTVQLMSSIGITTISVANARNIP